MLFKYAVDAALVWAFTHRLWTPLTYLNPLWVLREQLLRGAPAWLAPALVLWTLPFLWIGVSMTLRRAVDAGRSPWWCLLFFVPGVNYAVMLWLALLPSRADRGAPAARATAVDLRWCAPVGARRRSEEHTSELQSHSELVCRLLVEKKNNQLAR